LISISYMPCAVTYARADAMVPSSAKSARSIGAGLELAVSTGTSGTIHFAFHCAAPIKPVSQNAGVLHGDACPRSSHARTCQ
jgi:hypothetical protein